MKIWWARALKLHNNVKRIFFRQLFGCNLKSKYLLGKFLIIWYHIKYFFSGEIELNFMRLNCPCNIVWIIFLVLKAKSPGVWLVQFHYWWYLLCESIYLYIYIIKQDIRIYIYAAYSRPCKRLDRLGWNFLWTLMGFQHFFRTFFSNFLFHGQRRALQLVHK